MADKITQRDVVLLADLPELFGGKGWHGKGIPTSDFSIENPNILRACFIHEMAQAGAMVIRENGQREWVPGQDFYAIAQDDKQTVGGAVGKVWRSPDNRVLLQFFKDAIAGSGYDICSVGTVDNRTEFFVDAVGKLKSVAGRERKPYVGLNRMFGGMGSVIIGAHETVMQCANTTYLFRSSVAGAERVKNTLSIFERLPQVKIAIQEMKAIQLGFDLALEDGAKYLLGNDTARAGFVGFVSKSGKFGTRGINRVNRLMQLFKDGNGNSGVNATDWFNAVTDYFTHESVGESSSDNGGDTKEMTIVKQWYSSEHGTAATVKMELAQLLFPNGTFASDTFNGFVKAGHGFIEKLDKDQKALLN